MHDGKNNTIYELLRARAEHGPEAVAILAPGRSDLTYRGLLGQVDCVARSLIVRGVQPGDRVAIVLPNGPEMAVVFLGVATSAICAPLNPAYSRSEFEFYLGDLNPKALIVQSSMNSAVIAVAEERGIPIIELSAKPEAAAGIFTIRDYEQPLTSDFGFPQADDIALILHTSGTTSRPKMVPLTHANLLASAGNVAATLRLSEADRCLNVMPLFHIHGLVGALLSSVTAGASVVCASGFDIEQFFPWLEAFRPTWYTAVPTIHHAVLARAQAGGTALKNHSLRFIRSSSSALPARVMQGLEEIFKVPVIESYGMTEAAHQMASNPLPAGLRKVGSVGRAAGPEVSIMDETGHLFSTGEIGEIVIRGANVMHGYDNNSDANATVFTQGWFRTGDQGYLDKDGYLFITGRLKEIINRGGEKISPPEVDDVLLQHPAVAEAICFAMPHETLGEDIAAAVVLRESAAVTERELQRFVAAQLAEFKIPRRVLFVDEIPKSATGKPQRIGLADKFGALIFEQPIHEFLAPQTQVEQTLAAIWSEVLGVERIGIQDNFFNLGGDSIRATQVISRIRNSMQTEVSILSFFEAPTVAGLAECIEKFPRTTEPLLQTAPMQRAARNEKLPLSFAQQRLWFLNQLEPANPIYNRPLALRLTGKLQAQVIERCINEIVGRHEVLRTNFQDIDGEPIQVVAPNLTVELPIIDLSRLPHGAREAEALRQSIRESQQPFDLARGALLRARLYRLGEQDHLLLFVTHHIVFDGWSDSVLLREMAAHYSAILNNNSVALCDLPIQYADYATWQRQQSEEKTPDIDLSYWKQHLSNSPPLLSLPTDRPRPAVRSDRGARQHFALPAQLSERLKELSGREQVTLFMTLLAAFKALLYRYTGQEDILVGVPTAGRNRVETEQLLGVFINTIVLRSDLSGEPSFRELLRRVREVALGGYTHQDLPFEKLIEVLQPDRDLSRNPLFDVMFQLRNMPQPDVALPGLRSACVDLDIGVAKVDLTLEVIDEDKGLTCRFEYNTDLFDSATIIRMAGHFQTLLETIVANPNQRISELPLLTEAEKHQLLVEWNDTERDYPSDKCIHQLFEEQVERTPKAVAVVFEDQQLTYRELNNRANQLAHYLQKLGVGPDVLVGICVERSIEMVVGLLGILKAGGAYVPLDPSYPKERLAFMLEDAQVRVLLTQQKFLSSIDHRRVVCLDRDWHEIVQENVKSPQNQATTETLAYVIYTSGSTGTPKGTLITHYNVARLLQATEAWFRFNSNDVWTLFHSYAFDFSVWEIWGALLYGGKLVLVPHEISRSPQEFAVLLIQQRVTVLNQTPSAFRQLIPHLTGSATRDPIALRFVIFGGEALELQSLKPWFECYSDDKPKLINMYGITETTVHVTYRPIKRADIESAAGSVIGKPIPDLRVYLLDKHKALVPIGVAGEIYVGGAGVAKGYLGLDELTAERFITDPFSDDRQAKFYRSGDLARWLPDGDLEYLGRIDDQVKIRGFRIELGEIESVLARHDGVRETVVTTKEDSAGDKQIIAYIVPHKVAPATNELRNYLKAKLPDYMVPSAFVVIDSLPLTPNGKVDRRALPAPAQSRPELDETFSVPRTPTEELLANIWAEVLKLEKVGIHDNFFDLGGHSLLATQVMSRLTKAFQIELPLRSLFESPTVAGLAEHVEQTRRGKMGSPVLPILPMPRTGDMPLSFAQQRLWFLDQLEPNSSVYNVPSALRLKGPLDTAALEQSLNEIVRRHEALRTTFSMVEGQPVQRIAPSLSLPLSMIDLSQLPESEREDEARRLTNEEAQRPFDLERGPLARSVLLHLGSEDHVLLLSLHHIASDGWSMSILHRELSALYEAFSNGKPSRLETLPVQYADFAQWQREWLQGDVLGTQLGYWKKQLENVQTLQLPTDRPRPAVQSDRGARQSIVLSRELSEALKTLSRQQGVTLFMTLLAAFQTLLYRYTGQEDIAVGSPIAGRNRREIEGLIGFFVNTLVLRTDLSGEPSFLEVLRRVRESSLEAYAHQDLPFEKLVEELQPTRNLSQNPLFQVMFILQNAPREALEFAGLTMSAVKIDSTKAKFDLTLSIQNEVEGLRGSLQYSSDLFNEETITRMLGHFEVLLENIVANPNQAISALPILTDAERYQLLVERNDTKRDYPSDKCIHQLFEEQVERSPDSIALVFEDWRVTYRELNSKANQLAHHLKQFGVGANVLVAICMERSVEMIICLLGILKAGGAYVPLDPSYPKERLGFMLQDSGAPVLITQQAFVDVFINHTAKVIFPDTDWEKVGQGSESNLAAKTSPDSLAYVIYTSGSTGQPKGVAVSHQAINRLVMKTDYVQVTPSEVMAQASNVSFDAATFEIWGALLNGARLVLIAKDSLLSPQSLSTAIERHGITTLFLTTALFNQMVEQIPAALGKLRYLLFGGEAVDPQRVKELLRNGPPRRLLHVYGPTETTTFASWYWVRAVAADATTIPIGRPIANTEIYILDAHLNPVPIGVSGELYISGPGVARGYLNRPELTAEKFIANRFSNDPQARLYKTGDRARYLPNGNIEFLGRLDNQVKLRGYRIELSEIETVLSQHPAVREAVVLVREDSPGDKRLVGYVVFNQPQSPSAAELRSYLKEKLPEYMVPSAYVFLETLPLTPNGKVDRKALPASDQSRPELDETFAAPRTPVEEILASIWAGVLKLDKVGIHNNFFDLGGHSLLATQVISRVNNSFQIDIQLRRLFETPTIAELAASIDASLGVGEGPQRTPPIMRVPQSSDPPLSFAQQRLWFLDQLEPGSTVYNIPGAVRLRGPLDVAALEQSLNEIIRRHEALRTTFSTVEGEAVLTVSPSQSICVEVIDLSSGAEVEREEKARALAAEEARRPFNLSQGPLLRMKLLRLGEKDHILLLTLHHIVSDGWSMGVLYRELSVLYQAFSNSEPSPLPALTIQYADYAAWQREWLRGEELERQLSYWKSQLEGVPSVLKLPLDRPCPAVQSYRGGRESIELSKELTQRLGALSRSEGATLFMTMLAAYQTLLYRYTGQEDIVVGSPIAGRNRQETEGLIGFFVNTLVFRGDLSGNPTFKELLARVREAALGAYAHQDLPFEKLVEELHPERGLSHSPLVQVLFNMVNLELPKVDLAGTIAEPFFPSEPESKFDLTLYVREQNEQARLDLVYNIDLFQRASTRCFLQQYAWLLEQVVSAPEKPIRSFSLVTSESRRLLPDPTVELAEPSQPLVTNLVARWAEQTPTRCAVSQGQRTWTYGELAQCAHALARVMRATGVEPGDVVAVHGRRSFGVIASMIATFLSGGVLLLIDDSLPRQRKRLMLKEGRAKKLLFVGDHQPENGWLDANLAVDTLFVDAERGCAIERETESQLDSIALPEVTPDDPAYIFFTSGTTGIPKGVLGVHKGLSHFVEWQRERFAVTPNDRVAQLTVLSFDPVLREVFLALTSGAMLCLPKTTDAFEDDDVIGWLQREQISILHMVPSLAQSWLSNGEGEVSLPNMRWVFFMGEPLTDTLVRQWRQALANRAGIINLYGPTETTLVKCYYRVPNEIRPGLQPAGTPLPQTQALVLGENSQLCGVNELGEIVLRTPFRSLGYINAPKENEKRFVKNPFRDDARDLLYITGDVGRYRADGLLEILGRVDDQVKIRGVRVEPAEVTAVLSRHPAVESCFVVAGKNQQGENDLVAYVVASKRETTTTTQLRSYLAGQLPAALVPAFFIFLDAIPLTPNGKVDRQAVPIPNGDFPESDQDYVPARNAVEQIIGGIWSEVLGLKQVGVHDNFFDLGGHSLNATQIVSRLRKVFQSEIPLRHLFEFPTVAGLAERIEETWRKDGGAEGRPVLLVSRERYLPLSFAQRRLWFLDQLEPNRSVYNTPSAFRLRGRLDVAALDQSFNEIVRRHEVLRTTFSVVEGEPVQVILPSLTLPLIVVELSDHVEQEREEKARALAEEEARRSFDLSTGPLFRTMLLRLGEQDHILVLTLHHIVSDGWSMGVMYRELSALYQAFSNNEASPLPELTIQYADYGQWQRDWLKGEVLDRQLNYWRKRLGGIATLQLPTHWPRPSIQSFRGASQSITISGSLCDRLNALSRCEGVTMFMTLMAAFQTLLYRYTGQEDIAVGSPIAGRNKTELENLIGFFVNTLVLRSDLSGNPTFKALLARVREIALGAYAHQDLPFEKLVEELHPERNLSRSPLFQVMFTFQNMPMSGLQLPGLSTDRLEIESDTTKFDLTLTIIEEAALLVGSLKYNTDLFDASTISLMIGHLQVLLEGIVSNPDQRISELPILTAAERHQLLVEWNDTRRDYPTEKCIHELFEEQAKRTPEAVAVVFEDQQITYQELNAKANQLAHYLQKLAVGPDVLVGICMERSIEMMVGLLGILKAGGAYVPFDPQAPSDRLAFMLEDTQAAVLLAQQQLVERLPQHERLVCLDSIQDVLSQEPESNPDCDATGENLAYVMYTSGSTGKPKGVLIEHRQIVNYIQGITERYDLTPGASYGMAQPLSVDSSQTVIFPPLISGGVLHILSEDRTLDAKAFADYFARFKIDLLKIAPSHLAALQQSAAAPDWLLPRRWLIIGGEASQRDWVEELLETAPCAIFNHYGPTEATVGMLTYQITNEQGAGSYSTVPTGKPLPNTEAYVLDRNFQPVPGGISGELFIGGSCLSRGYLNLPELTAEKFIYHSFNGEPPKRLYRTGDLVRYRPDGNIEFLGRTDHQVKIRGFRVELGEIEAVLMEHPAVEQVIVTPQIESGEQAWLVAYVVRSRAQGVTLVELRDFLRKKLPDYMIPSAFMLLDVLPLTPHGKVDRKALPAPDRARLEQGDTYVEPRTVVEKELARIWAAVLKVERVGVYDNFFDLGGHSLLATQVMSRLMKAFQIELPLRSLFESPTVAGLAERVEQTRRQEQGLQTLPMLAVSREKDLPVSFAQQRLWFLDQYEPNSSVYNISSALQLKGPLDVGALEQSLNEIVRRHESLRTTFAVVDGEPVQVIAPALMVSVPITDLKIHPASEREKEAQKLAMEQAREPFDLSQGPLLRVMLLCLGEDDHVLVLTMHHIVSDGWSMGVLYRELSLLYQAYTQGNPSPLSELAIQYADFAVWQRQWLQGEVLENQLSYWKKQLAGAPAFLNLHTDRPRPTVQTYRGARQSIELSQELTEGLRALSAQQGVTLFMTLLAAFQTLLQRYTGQNDIVVGSPIANRNHAEIEGHIGFFVNTLVLRTDLSGNLTFKELLTRVRETALGAYTHQDLPFEKLVEEIHPERSLSHSPLFQVLFNMDELGDSHVNLSGLEVERFPTADVESKFDLTIYARSQPGGIQLNLVYNADLFHQPRMTCVLQQYRYLLEQIVDAPEKRVRAYSLVTPESRLFLPDPSTILSEAPQQLVSGTFLSWANQSPDHPAVSQGGRSWTYRKLAECAETLALAMVAKGLERGDVVAIYGDRSFGMIAGMIATLLSGGILLPIDRILPDRRKQLMLRESKAKKFLYVGAKQADDAWLEEEFNLDIIRVEQHTGCALTAETKPNLNSTQLPGISADDAAYIFFTSGSTGVPKGVLGCHKGLSHFLNWQRTTFAIGPDDRIAQLTSLSFDVVLRDIFLPLTSGATLCLPEATLEIGSDQTVDWLAQERISVLHTVPTVAQAWFESLPQGASLAYMRGIFFAGEPLPAALVKRCREIVPKCCEIVNLYGPTETTLAKCFYRVPADDGVGVLPVGQPIPNTQALVFADDHRLCGINEVGEIVLRTPFRSLGCINAPQDSRQRFLKNPFRDDNQDLIYFTGDAGRYRPDGTLEILGRLDDQVKIRGVRVEPAEVTAILDRHPLVKSCIVVTGTNEREEPCLVAYVVLSAQDNLTSNTLRSYLRAHLPAAMVPSNFVFLDKLPLTPNGKVDRSGLPMPESVQRSEFVAPRTPVEKKIAEIWAEVLRVDKVAIDDNFFELGGHSLLATQVVSRMRAFFKFEIPLRTLFEASTLEDLASIISRQQASQVSETEMERFLEELEAMSNEEAERSYKVQLTKSE